VDVLIIPPDNDENCRWIMKPLLANLRKRGFLTDDLAGG
jgi:hypothetical protein